MAALKNSRRATEQNKAGLEFYESWELEKAITAFQKAVEVDPENPEYHLNLARTFARSGDFGQAMHALGDYLHNETKDEIATRYEHLFSSALDGVEQSLTEVLPQLGMALPQIGKALQMWLEYRIVAGRRPLSIPQPELWAAAITYAIHKVNLNKMNRAEVAAAYGVKEGSLQKKYQELVQVLDLMPADYRYFLGEENPLDDVVEAGETPEASQILDDLERRFMNG